MPVALAEVAATGEASMPAANPDPSLIGTSTNRGWEASRKTPSRLLGRPLTL